MGSGCFSSRKQAEKHRQEFLEGRHSEINEETLNRLSYYRDDLGNIQYDDSFDRMMKSCYDDYYKKER
jgi:hypothetical protein